MTTSVAFWLGVVATMSLAITLYFFKFWNATRDYFFLALTGFFLIEAITRVALLFFAMPDEGSPWIYLSRLFAVLLIIAAIVRKNYKR